MDLLSEVIFETNDQGRLVYVNKAWSTVFGDEPYELPLRPFHTCIHPESRDTFAMMIAAAAASRTCPRQELRILRKDGSSRWAAMTLEAHGDGGFVGVATDISLQKAAQEQLSKLSLVANFTDSLIAITDSRGMIEWVNQSFVRHTGHSIMEAVGHPIEELLNGPDADRVVATRVRDAVVKQVAMREELVSYTKSGEPYWITLHITPVRSPQGKLDRFVVIQHDITARKRNEQSILDQKQLLERNVELRTQELVKAKDDAEAATRAKGGFIANMSHEIRTPLNAIVGFTHLCLQTELTPKQREYVSKTEVAAKNLMQIVNDILDFSKIEAGSIRLEQAPFDLHAVLNNVDSMVGLIAKRKYLDFNLDVAKNVTAFLQGDALRLEQVLLNLVGNAVKFTEKGAVTVEVQRVRADAESIELAFHVKDTGIGISPEQQQRLFQAFSQADDSTARIYGGTGLGLVICSRLIKEMGGRIWVESQAGVGSTFSFTAHFGRTAGTQPVAILPDPDRSSATRTERLKGRRVLVVEDNEFNQTVIVDMLHAVGIDTKVAGNGLEALQCLETDGAFDLVLMDVQMPGIDGYEATRRIRKHPRVSGIRIVAMTANARLEDKRRCLESGMDDFQPKPIDPEGLYTMLQRVLFAPAQALAPQASPEPKPKPAFDPNILRDMFPESPEYVREMANKFVRHASAAVPRMRDAQATKNAEALRDIGHKYKSSAAMIGANRVAVICAELERRGRTGELDGCDELIGELPGLLDQIEQAFNADLTKENPVLTP